MPSRKQRRRREKLKRHDYEYVIETEDGEEIPVDRPPARDGKNGSRDARKADPVLRDRRGRPVPKPSLQRVLKRTMVLFPLALLFVFVTSPNATMVSKFLTALSLVLFFIPFSYMVDLLLYRSMLKRAQRSS